MFLKSRYSSLRRRNVLRVHNSFGNRNWIRRSKHVRPLPLSNLPSPLPSHTSSIHNFSFPIRYNPDSINAAIVAGTLDSVSSGILLYTGLVELLAHDFIFNRKMIDASNGELAYSLYVCSSFLLSTIIWL